MARRILVVDDSPHVAGNLEIALSGIAPVQLASNAADALRIARDEGEICAIVTDLEMPRMDGYELIRQLRTGPVATAVPIVVISAATDPQAQERAMNVGASAFFAKPYSPAEVRRELVRLMQSG
jgi:CheY-like chemotaxis protein